MGYDKQAHRSWDEIIKDYLRPNMEMMGYNAPGGQAYGKSMGESLQAWRDLDKIPALYSGYNLTRRNMLSQMNNVNASYGDRLKAEAMLGRQQSQAANEAQMQAKTIQAQGLQGWAGQNFQNYMTKLQSLMSGVGARAEIDMRRAGLSAQQNALQQQAIGSAVAGGIGLAGDLMFAPATGGMSLFKAPQDLGTMLGGTSGYINNDWSAFKLG